MKYLLGTILTLSFGMASCAAAESEPPNEKQTTSERGDRPQKGAKGEKGTKGENGAKGEKGDKGKRGNPPQAAFDACVDKAVEAACTVVTPRGEREGTCKAGRGEDKETLICAPARGSRPEN